MATYHVDLVNGNDANDGSTWALAKKTPVLTGSSSSEYTVNKIAKTAVTSLGQNAQWTNQSKVVTLTSQVTQQIEDAVGNTWTFSTGVSGTTDTTRKLGASRQRINILNSFTNGKIAYKTLPSTLDLSTYQKISFWVQTNNVAVANSRGLRICLCSDANGDTIVNSLTLDQFYRNTIFPMTLDYGSALGNNINSIALYCDNTIATTIYVYLNHIFAANDLHLKTLIGKGSAQTSQFFAVQSIVGTDLCIDSGESISTASRGYYGTTENVELFVRQLIDMPLITIPNNYYIVFDCGWNTTSDEQDGETWFDARICTSSLFIINTGGYVGAKNMGFAGQSGIDKIIFIENLQITAGTFSTRIVLKYIDGLIVTNGNSVAIQFNCPNTIIKNVIVNSHIVSGNAVAIVNNNSYYENLIICNNSSKGLGIGYFSSATTFHGAWNYLKGVTLLDNASTGIVVAHCGNIIDNINNTQMEVFNEVFIKNSPLVVVGSTSYNIYEFNRNNVPGAYRFSQNSSQYIEWQTAVKHMAEPGALYIYSSYPHPLPFNQRKTNPFKIAEIAVEQGVQTTIRAWVTANWGGTIGAEQARLEIRAIKSPAVDTDYSVYVDKDNVWHEVGLTFIPDRTGIVVLEFSCNVDFYVGSISIT